MDITKSKRCERGAKEAICIRALKSFLSKAEGVRRKDIIQDRQVPVSGPVCKYIRERKWTVTSKKPCEFYW